VQAQCSQCATRIQIDDAKVPDRPFKVRCPKCQTILSLPGRGSEAEAPEPAAAQAPPTPEELASPPEPPEPPAPTPSAAAKDALSSAPGPQETEHRERLAESDNDALVALSGPIAAQLQQVLRRLGFRVETVDDIEQEGRLLEQGVYEVAVTARTASEPGKPETLAERILRMAPDVRRRVFVILVGNEFRSGDGTQAWAAQADAVLHPNDVGRADNLIRALMAERKRLYQPFLDAQRRVQAD
jgi:predicted Zn finger-like uncharacterized protein